LKLALILAISTGQRQGDLLKMTWGQYDGAWIDHRQSKGKKRVPGPIHRDLKKVLDRVPRRSTLILTTPLGLPWKSDWLRNRWRAASVAVGIKDLHVHELRGTAVTMFADAGCSNAEIAAITGHSMQHVETILTKYVSFTRGLAQSAMARLENAGSDFSGLV
jgi:integrase